MGDYEKFCEREEERNDLLARADAAEGVVKFLLTLVPEWATKEEPGLDPTMYGTGSFETDKVIIDKVKAIKAEWEKKR